jgi:hypothetical protein
MNEDTYAAFEAGMWKEVAGMLYRALKHADAGHPGAVAAMAVYEDVIKVGNWEAECAEFGCHGEDR